MKSGWLIILILMIIISTIYFKYQRHDVIYVKSDLDSEYYLVRNVVDKQYASNMLAKIKKNIMMITDYLVLNCETKYMDSKPYIMQLHEKIRNAIFVESTEDSIYTSYSVNKGEQIVFCVRSKRLPSKIHDFNLMMYVVLHEISHVACPEYGHTLLFKKIFAFITNVAISLKMYNKINFRDNPEEYCGLMINDSIV